MTEHERRHPMGKQLTVADYIVQRLAREGITDCFGVAGDFAFKLDDAVAAERGDPLDRLFQRAGRGVRGRRLRPRAGLFDALDHVRRRRAVRAQRRDGGQGRAVVRLPPGRHADDAQAAGPPDRPPHARRRGVPELREHLGAGGVRFGGDHSRQLRPRNGAADRHGAGGEPARLHPRRLRLRRHAGHRLRRRPRTQNPQAAPTWPRPLRRSPSGFNPPDPSPSSPPTPSRGSSSRTSSRR